MGIKVGPIKFNLAERGYKAFGNNRNFNIPLLVASINSPATQERVKGRNMFGFYGHWPRVKFGHLTSVEGGLDNGKPAIVEPALVTTHLKAYPDGTIEHEAEFLDTEAGRTAARLHQSRAGGFSSVIDNIKSLFVGLDYVLEPNFRANRGYSLDSAAAGLTFDDACGMELTDIEANIRDEQLRAMHVILDSAESREKQLRDLAARLEAENEELLSILAKRDPAAASTFDSATFSGRQVVTLDMAAAQQLMAKAAEFATADLAELDKGGQESASLKMPDAMDHMRQGLLHGTGATYG